MTRKSAIAGSTGADVAAGRAAFYGLLVGVFGHLPDRELVAKIERGDFQSFLTRCCELGHGRLDSGLQRVTAYQAGIKGRPGEEVLTELSVDRTKILRGTGHPDLKPPYEGLYRRKENMGYSVLEVRRFYRKAGLLPDETVRESADYLCVELDFMKELCLLEQSRWLDEEGVRETVAREEEFLRRHLGNWVGDFCTVVEKHAFTDFYRGFSLILDAFIGMEKEWLEDLMQQLN
jgi:TorA maturation chaperone TorD